MRTLWYQQPAREWNEALPLGNGRFGAMVYGDPCHERLQLNEDSMFYGAPQDRINPDALPNLSAVRSLILQGQIAQAERLIKMAFSSMPARGRPYQPIGELFLDFDRPQEGITAYTRTLSLEEAVHTTRFTAGGMEFCHESFASAPDDVAVMHLHTDTPGQISFTARLSRDCFANRAWAEEGTTIALEGDLGKGGLEYCLMLTARATGGHMRTMGEFLIVEGADAVTLHITGATTYRHRNPRDACRTVLDKAAARGYAALRSRHVEDYQGLFTRLTLDLPADETLDALPTDARLLRMKETEQDNGLLATYFDYGRYLLIASSRPGSMPANLQGLWNPHYMPPWESRYTININTQMNYWPAESGNLSECHLPLMEMTKRLIVGGRKVARRMYGCRGSVAHHNADLWNDAAPYDHWIPGTYWVMGAAWLCLHLWMHYDYTRDTAFLHEAYPYMREAALFFEDFLIEENGYLIACPTVSPENSYRLPNGEQGAICAGCAMDNALLRDFFTACIDASTILGMPEAERESIAVMREKLAPLEIGKHGQIMEWMQDYDEVEPGHRHISQLYALFPSAQITPDGTPELAEAARATLTRRLASGGGHTGWSRAWIVNMYAHLWDGNEAYHHLVQLLARSTLPNLLDNHPPFQIDGNFGGTAGVLEMLVQCDDRRVVLLPALPDAWSSGRLTGARLRGNLSVDLIWQDGVLSEAVLTAHAPAEVLIQYREQTWPMTLTQGATVSLTPSASEA